MESRFHSSENIKAELPIIVNTINRYLKLHGKRVTDRQVLSLHKYIRDSATKRILTRKSPYADEIKKIAVDLEKTYRSMGSACMYDVPPKLRSQLTTIIRAAETFLKKPNTSEVERLQNKNRIVKATELAGMKFSSLYIRGKFGRLLGKPYDPFSLMIYGQRYNGKSSAAMLLAEALSKKGLKVLYVADEEGVKGTMQEKLLRLKITRPDFVEEFQPSQIKEYDVVFLDSVQTIGLKTNEFKELKAKFPKTSFVLVFKANRDGTSKGGTDWEHDVDAVMHIENGMATMEKNRFPGAVQETIKII